nr:hypothetical protein [Tanacetum cinerariifolium]
MIHFMAQVPGRIIVTPNRGGGIFIYSQAIPSMIEHFNWMHRVRHTHFNLCKRLRDEILNSGSKSKEVLMNLIVVPENGKGSFHFTSASNAAKKMMEIAASGMQQPKEVLTETAGIPLTETAGIFVIDLIKLFFKYNLFFSDNPGQEGGGSDEQESSEEERSDEDEEPKTAKKNSDVETVDAPSAKKAVKIQTFAFKLILFGGEDDDIWLYIIFKE